jgi:hypothetical protein
MGSSYCGNNRRKANYIYEDFFADRNSINYDMILNFYSFLQLKKNGWTCYFTPEGKEKYDKCIKEYNIVIGILGMKNRGKSYLLGRIMENDDYKPPSGFLITTYGISCNFPKNTKTGSFFITLDTAGKDSPLLQNDLFKDNIKSFARDQVITEVVLSDFIIQESNILIAVLEQLSFEEQEMLKTLIERLKKKEIKGIQKRRLIVIHNLMNIATVEDIKNFIDNVLLKSLTFKLEPQSMRGNENYDDSNKVVYIQNVDNENENNNQNKLEIIHLIFGNDEEENIRREYNEPALRYIRDYITINSTRKFDIVKSFKDFIYKNSSKYLTGDEFKEDSIIIGKPKNKKFFSDKEETNQIDKIIIPIKSKNLNFEVKGFVKGFRGNETFFNKINPRYSSRLIKKNEKYYIEILFELFGKIKKLKRKILSDNDDKNQYIILIKGEIEEFEKIEKVYGNLEYTEFDFQVIIQKFYTIEKFNKEIEIEIIEEAKEKDIKYEENKLGIYKLLLESEIYYND